VLERQELVEDMWARMAGGTRPELDDAVYHSELETADRNYALGYLIRERGMLPEESDLLEALDLYFRCCSLELDVRAMSVVAATLANGGVCPTDGRRAAAGEHVRACLSLMSSCGMYVMGVVPNVLGFAVWSPRLDSHGNSVRGLDFCRRLVDRFKFHSYDSLLNA
jgi:glutaminase